MEFLRKRVRRLMTITNMAVPPVGIPAESGVMRRHFVLCDARAVAAALAIAVASLGCNLLGSEVGESDIALAIEVAQAHYSVQADSIISVRLLNEGDHPVYTRVSLPYVVLERRIGNEWEELPLWYGWLAVVLPLVEVMPGDSLVNTLRVGDEVFPGFGTYRFRYQLFLDRDFERPLSVARRISTTFVLGE